MLLTKNGLTLWTLANVIASAVFIHFASWTWLSPNLRGEDVARAGDGLIWGFTAFPVLAFTLLSNSIGFAFAVRERRRNKEPWPTSSIVITVVIWISLLLMDHLRGLGF